MTEKIKILVVEDDKAYNKIISESLIADGYDVKSVFDKKQAILEIDKSIPDLLILDLSLPPSNKPQEGLSIFNYILKKSPHTKVMIISGTGTFDMTMSCIKKGASDYIEKPFNLNKIEIAVERILAFRDNEINYEELKKSIIKKTRLGDLIGISPSMQKVFIKIENAANHDENILIMGETGTGKNLAAKTIHNLSNRSNERFIDINCTTIHDAIIESELFGHEKGAFTDAKNKKIGLFEYAKDGTVFLDEIGDISLNLQKKLLEVIENKTFRRVGSVFWSRA